MANRRKPQLDAVRDLQQQEFCLLYEYIFLGLHVCLYSLRRIAPIRFKRRGTDYAYQEQRKMILTANQFHLPEEEDVVDVLVLILSMLNANPESRPTISAVLRATYFNKQSPYFNYVMELPTLSGKFVIIQGR